MPERGKVLARHPASIRQAAAGFDGPVRQFTEFYRRQGGELRDEERTPEGCTVRQHTDMVSVVGCAAGTVFDFLSQYQRLVGKLRQCEDLVMALSADAIRVLRVPPGTRPGMTEWTNAAVGDTNREFKARATVVWTDLIRVIGQIRNELITMRGGVPVLAPAKQPVLQKGAIAGRILNLTMLRLRRMGS